MNPTKWLVVADFFTVETDSWLDNFVDDPELVFQKVVVESRAPSWHEQSKKVTGIKKWLGHFRQARKALKMDADGIVTCFPPLALCVGLLMRIRRKKLPVVAYTFNIGRLVPGIRQSFARFAARDISVFVVHSPSEVTPYAEYLGVNSDRVIFVPLQRPKPKISRSEKRDDPYILAMGSAHRDYRTLIDALEELRPPTIIVTRRDEIAALPQRDWITYLHSQTRAACLELLAGARLSVTPVSNTTTASGQITFINAMQMGVPVIATDSPGTAGYLENGHTGRLVRPGDASDLRDAIETLWNDEAARSELAARANGFAQSNLSDDAAALRLSQILKGL